MQRAVVDAGQVEVDADVEADFSQEGERQEGWGCRARSQSLQVFGQSGFAIYTALCPHRQMLPELHWSFEVLEWSSLYLC